MNDSQDNWENMFEQLPLESAARDQHRQDLKAQVLDEFDQQQRPHSKLKRTGQILMKFKLPQIAIAVAVIAAIAVFQFGGSPAYALENMVSRIVNAKSARWESVVDLGEHGRHTTKHTVIPGSSRQENEDGSILIFDWKTARSLTLMPDTKMAVQMDLDEGTKDYKSNDVFTMLQGSLDDRLKSGDLKDARPTTEKTLNNRTLDGFEIGDGITIWVEPNGDTPTQIEIALPDGSTVLMQNYEADIEVDESLFSVDVPEGYTTRQANISSGLPTEADFIVTLRLSCEASSDGTFPAGLGPNATGKAIVDIQTHLMKDMNLDPSGLTGHQISALTNQVRGFAFATMTSVDPASDAHYAGANVKLDTENSPIFWYKPNGSEKYRVIFADLTVVEQDSAPAIEGAIKLAP